VSCFLNEHFLGAARTSLSRCARGRRLAVVAAIVFFISSAFPVVAGLARNTGAFPKWWGILDVGLAFVLAILAFVIMSLTQGEVDKQVKDCTYRVYRVLLHGILAMIVVFFLFGNHITWTNCITGIGWRAWLLLYGLPAWLTALKSPITSEWRFPGTIAPWWVQRSDD